MSEPCAKSTLDLDIHDLRIPLQETVTGGDRVKRHRQKEMIYRLGFDLILKCEFGDKTYMPVPSIKKSMLADGFDVFCLWAAELKDRKINLNQINYSHYYHLAEEKFWLMERMSLVQQVFYSIIEAWIVLDKALYLEANGYQADISTFCEKSITPRNLLINAFLNH